MTYDRPTTLVICHVCGLGHRPGQPCCPVPDAVAVVATNETDIARLTRERDEARAERDAVIASMIAKNDVHWDAVIPRKTPDHVYRVLAPAASFSDYDSAAAAIRAAAGLPVTPTADTEAKP